MDDAARLVSELHDKLAELDGKVAAYQRDMLAEFHKHMDECLQKCPDHVSREVSQLIAASVFAGMYPALAPQNHAVPQSPATDRCARDGRKSPPPILRHTSGTPKESPRDPHAREKEFQGLFTPTYLPLLERSDRPLHSPPISPPPTSAGPALTLSAGNVKKVEELKQVVSADHEGRPDTVRRLTDWSTSSLDSSGSDSKLRRSALRRSSSSNKGSPRRVRFEFEGEEVFPASSSPQASALALAAESGAEPQPEAETPVVATEDESSAYVGTSLLDVEGEEDLLPRPRKVSSTQALQALTRSPLEEGSTWTVVNPDTEAPAKMNGEKQPERASGLPAKVDSQATIRAGGAGKKSTNGHLGAPLEEPAVYDDEDANASDDEFLSMPNRRKSSSPAATNPFTRPPLSRTPAANTATETNGGDDMDDDGLDPLFDFDDEVGPTTSTSQKYLPEPESDEDPIPGRLRQAAREEQQTAEASAAANMPPVSPSSVLFGHSIGSYMGKSMTINPIKDAKLYDEIANMKDVYTFVGSIHDRPAAEAVGLGSYRASSLARGAGAAPRSFAERFALEEEMERRRAAGEEDV